MAKFRERIVRHVSTAYLRQDPHAWLCGFIFHERHGAVGVQPRIYGAGRGFDVTREVIRPANDEHLLGTPDNVKASVVVEEPMSPVAISLTIPA
jgi:hypothetical protein